MPTGVVSLIVCTVQPYSCDVKIEEGLNGFCFHFCDGLKGFDFTFLFASCSTIKMYLDILNQNSSFTHHCYVATTVKPFSLKHLQAEIYADKQGFTYVLASSTVPKKVCQNISQIILICLLI